jgi:outer membrane receptor protein involved in Fe transport
MRQSLLLRGTASLFALAAMATAAQAQSGPQGPGDSPTTGPMPQSEAPAQEANTVDAIVVTAQRREQSLQDVPVVVTAISEETLEDAGVRDIKDLQIVVPGLTVTSTSSETVTTARIRGVGTVGDNPGLESSVGITIDGVYRPRNGVGFQDLGELSRVEVLKGPQGTLFGRNTSAGVINVITEAPSFTFGAEGELTVGNYGNRRAAGSVTGPITDNLAGRLFLAREVRDGFYDVRTGEGPRTETEDQNRDFYTVRGQLLFNVTDALNLRLIGDYTERDEDCCVAVQIRTGPTGAIVDFLATDEGVLQFARPFDRIAFSNRGTEQFIEDGGVSLEGNLDLTLFGEDATLTSITAFRFYEAVNGQDSDFTSADILYRPADGTFSQRFETFTQEVRLAGTVGRLDYLVGGFYVNEKLDRNDRGPVPGADGEAYISTFIVNALAGIIAGAGQTPPAGLTANGPLFLSQATGRPFGTSLPNGGGLRDVYEQETKSLALFTHNIFEVTDQIDLTLGLRYTTEEKSLSSKFSNVDQGAGCAALLARTQTGIPAALIARGVPAAYFTPGSPLLPLGTGLIQQTVGIGCLPFFNPGFNNRTTEQDRTEEELTGTGKISYSPTDDLLIYASYARGYKSGGFNLDRSISSNGLPTGGNGVVPVADTSFSPEFVDSYELGFKSTLLDGALLFNATYFDQTFTGFQLNTFLGTNFVVESIPEVTSKGVDLDLIYLAPFIDGLTFQGGVTYADTRYSEFGPSGLIGPARFQQLQLLPGERLSFAPEFSGSASVSLEQPVGPLVGRLFLGAKYTSAYNTKSDLLPFGRQDDYVLINGRLGLGTPDDRVRVELFAQNLTDQDYYQVVFNQTLQGSAFPTTGAYNVAGDSTTYGAFLGQPRTFGVTLRLRY